MTLPFRRRKPSRRQGGPAEAGGGQSRPGQRSDAAGDTGSGGRGWEPPRHGRKPPGNRRPGGRVPVAENETPEDTPGHPSLAAGGRGAPHLRHRGAGDEVWLIDKHAAHERMNFDRLKALGHKPMRQMLLQPLVLKPAPRRGRPYWSGCPAGGVRLLGGGFWGRQPHCPGGPGLPASGTDRVRPGGYRPKTAVHRHRGPEEVGTRCSTPWPARGPSRGLAERRRGAAGGLRRGDAGPGPLLPPWPARPSAHKKDLEAVQALLA